MKLAIIYLVLLLACYNTAYAKPGFGVKETGDEFKKSFIISDFYHQSPDEEGFMGFYRYGIGRGQLELGSPSGIFTEANGGVLLTDREGWVAGLEALNHTLDYHNTFKAQLRPGISGGYTKGGLYVAARALYGIANNPDLKQGFGVGTVIQYGPLVYWENPGTKIYSVTFNDNINIERRMESEAGETWMFVVKKGF